MYKAVLLSVVSPTTLGIYHEDTQKKETKLIFAVRLEGRTSDILPLLFAANHKKLESILTPQVLAKCSLYECLIDCHFIKENSKIMRILKNIKQDNAKRIFHKSDADSKKVLDFKMLQCKLNEAIHLLSHFVPLDAIYYSRGVGSLSAIKLTHVFLHTLSLSSDIKLYATNSFYFTQANEIKAFANMSFYLKLDSKHIVITDSNVKDYIHIAPSSLNNSTALFLPYRLIHNDFLESCTPLYVTPAV